MLLSAHSADITQNLQKCMMMIDLKQNQIGRFCYTIEFTPSQVGISVEILLRRNVTAMLDQVQWPSVQEWRASR